MPYTHRVHSEQQWTWRRLALAVGETVAIVFLAILLRMPMEPWLTHAAPFAFYFPANAYIAWRWGFLIGSLGVFLSTAGAVYMHIPPYGELRASPSEVAVVLVLLLSGHFIVYLGSAYRRVAMNLERQEQLVRLMADTMPIAVAYVDSEETYRFCNRRYTEWFGHPRIGKTRMPDLLGEHVYALREQGIRQVLQGMPYQVQAKTPRPSGEWVESEVIYSPDIRDGSVRGFVILVMDVAELRRTRDVLRVKEEQLRLALRVARMGTWDYDAKEDRVVSAESTEMMFGFSIPSETRPLTEYLDRIVPQDRERLRRVMKAAIESGNGVSLEYRVQTPGNLARWLAFRGETLVGDDGTPRIVGAVFDITDRKEAEMARDVAAELSALGLELANMGVWQHDPRTDQVVLDARCQKIFGLKGAIQTKSDFFGMILPKDLPRVESLLAATLKVDSNRTFEARYRIVRTDGLIRWVSVRGRSFFEGEECFRFVGNLIDVTEQVEAERVLMSMNAELERRVEERTTALVTKNEELESFTYSAAHDLRAPIRGIVTNTQILLEDEPDALTPTALERVVRANHAARHLGSLVEDLLAYARTGQRELRRETIDLAEILTAQAEEASTERGALELCLNLEPAIANADPILMTLALRNIADNSCKYRKPDQPVCLTLTVEEVDGERRYLIRDRGVGFDPRYAEKMFQPFERLHGSDVPGTGIGLANVRRIIERHGGRIWSEGAPGVGTDIYFTLPYQSPNSNEPDPNASPSAG